ncbi:MAG: GntR family transcriptional regulator [Candidatus Omnitrophota bacterium]
MNTLYLQIKDYLSDEIGKRNAGELLPAESQLCEMFRVSRVPVRRAMEDLVKDGLIYRKKGKGTFVRKIAASQQPLSFTVVLPMGDREIPFYSSICMGIIAKATELRADTHILPFTSNRKSVLDKVENSPETGIIWVAPVGDDHEVLEELREQGYHVMILNRVMKNSHFNYISTDHRKGARDITLHLLDKGHKKIGFVGRWELNPSFVQRYAGFLEAFQLRGMDRPDGMMECVDGGELLTSSGLKTPLTKMFSRYSPTALFLCGGNFIEPVLTWMKEAHLRVAENLEIATFDEVPPSHDEKALIHEVIQPLREMGVLAVEEMRKILSGKKNLVRITLPPSIRIKSQPGRA